VEAAGLDQRRVTVAIEGFGAVAGYLAERLPDSDFSIIAVSTSKGAVMHRNGFPSKLLVSLRRKHGGDFVRHLPEGRRIEKEELLELEVDILVPSARTWVINERNADKIRARCVVPVANAPYTERAIEMLHERGIVCLPGFVTNAGGVYASSLYDSGVALQQIEQLSSTYYRDVIATLLARSRELAQSPVRIAETIACQRLASSMSLPGEAGGQAYFLKKAFRKKLIPRSVYGELMLRTCMKCLVHLNQQLEGASVL
jgi:glutamate dehydrogenase (NAD(P)+)